MKVLIIDDRPEKIKRIEESILSIVPTTTFIHAGSYLQSKFELEREVFDFIVCDMQFPIINNGMIDREAGIHVLGTITKMNLKAKVVVASSSDNVNILLENRKK